MSLSLLFFDSMNWTGAIRGSIESIMKPELWAISGIDQGIETMSKSVQFSITGRETMAEMEKKLITAQKNLVEEQEMKAENEQMKKVLGSSIASRKFHLTPSRVLSNGPAFVIENVNYSPGQIVVTPDGVFLGIIIQTGTWNAKVRLVTDKNSMITVSIMKEDGSEIDGELYGEFGASMTVEKVLSQFELSPGLSVMTRGSEDAIPPHILIGKIGKRIDHEASAVYQRASVEPMADIGGLSSVMVIGQGGQ